MRRYDEYELRYVMGHIEVFLHGKFQFSADKISEAISEIESDRKERDLDGKR